MKKCVSLILVFLLALGASSSIAFAAQVPNESEMILLNVDQGGETVQPAWLAYGPIVQYPSTGGVWEYGFWNAKVRSYYTVDRCHGSTVQLNDRESRSVDTAAGYTSIAELWAIQTPGGEDRYYYRVCD